MDEKNSIYGDWGLGIGDLGLGPNPNPQSPIPILYYIKKNFNIKYLNKECSFLFEINIFKYINIYIYI